MRYAIMHYSCQLKCFQTVYLCSNQFSDFFTCFLLAQASGLSELIGPPPLAYKKWRFDGQNYITDIASCGEL